MANNIYDSLVEKYAKLGGLPYLEIKKSVNPNNKQTLYAGKILIKSGYQKYALLSSFSPTFKGCFIKLLDTSTSNSIINQKEFINALPYITHDYKKSKFPMLYICAKEQRTNPTLSLLLFNGSTIIRNASGTNLTDLLNNYMEKYYYSTQEKLI